MAKAGARLSSLAMDRFLITASFGSVPRLYDEKNASEGQVGDLAGPTSPRSVQLPPKRKYSGQCRCRTQA